MGGLTSETQLRIPHDVEIKKEESMRTDDQRPSLSVRRADIHDADLLARLGATTFTQAFAAVNSAEDMAAYLASAFGPEIQAAELRQPESIFLIVSVDGEPAGYAQIQVTDPPEGVHASRPIELVRFYLDAAWHGQGVSKVLMGEVLAVASLGRHDIIWLGVWEHNGRAISFYRKWGFEVVGNKSFRLGSDLQTDYLMSRSLLSH
jgi:ribosomal protein S18 acetylase RimI-like enzyme